MTREDNDLGLGLPSATTADEERTRCRVCAGRHGDDGTCERCGVTRDEADSLLGADVTYREAGTGRYEVYVVQQDGNPRRLATCDTLAEALALEELLYPWAHRRLHGFVGVTDEQDGERGWLNELSYVEGLDAGPDPVAP